jgi:hypothetical protein
VDAPKGRYSVVEKDGRLVVIDNGTGAPIPSTFAPPAGRPGQARSSMPMPISDSGPGPLDRAADFLVTIAARERDAEGRAVIAWKWTQDGHEKRWDARLDERQQRRLGRALLVLAATPPLLILLLFAGGGATPIGFLLTLPLAAWAAVSIQRLYRQTNDPRLAG